MSSPINAVLAHGGGPTAVINASLAGLVEQTRHNPNVRALYGAHFGVEGLLRAEFTDLLALSTSEIRAIGQTPGSAIGSSRRNIGEQELERMIEIFRAHDVHQFFYTGGNGSMNTALRVHQFARAATYDLTVIGIPKTIDNDLAVTDHTPGYGSTARFFAHAARDVGEDNRSLPSPICILETLGRNAGWIVAATAFARRDEDDAPHLIYFPERRVSLEHIASDAARVSAKFGRCVIAVCEGQLDENGQPFGAAVDRPDVPQHRLATNLGYTLARLLTEKTGLRARAEKPGLLGRCCGPFTSEIDRREAFECGIAAARAAAEGQSGHMVALRRHSTEPYAATTFLTALETVALTERTMPAEWIGTESGAVSPEFLAWARPLVGEIAAYPRIRFR